MGIEPPTSCMEGLKKGWVDFLKAQTIFFPEQDLLPQIFVCQRQLYFPSRVNVINGHG